MMAAAIGVFVYLVGLCVGSFLNVVVYRLPRGLSITKPTWSFCPHCGTTLQWYDNLPVLGWLLLKGKCRYCRRPISAQYPLIEAITGLAFVLAYYLLVIAAAREGTEQPTWPADIPIILAWLVLVAVLTACSAMDLLWYVVDTRVTDVALIAGLVLYAVWPRPEFYVERAATPGAAAALVAFVVSGLMLWRTVWCKSPSDEEEKLESEALGEAADTTPPAPSAGVATIVATLALVGLAIWLLAAASSPAPHAGSLLRWAVPAALLALFAAMVLAGGQPREIDDELRATIEAEAPGARREAVREMLWLAPATVTAIATYVLVANLAPIADAWRGLTAWMPIGRFAPLGGIAFAVHGAIVAAAAGWIIRIFFTLVFGREAFGTGDIYILAAAGAVGGWDIALFGFLLSVFIALLGWILGLLLKRPGMIPFGPPLALGFLVALWLNRRAAAYAQEHQRDFTLAWEQRPDVVLLAGGILLIALPVSIVLAKLLRRIIEPREEQQAQIQQDEESDQRQEGSCPPKDPA